jgi:hypothetical protein
MLLVLSALPGAVEVIPQEESVRAAYADCLKLPAEAQRHALYLWTGAVPTEHRKEFDILLRYHVNQLSRGGFLVPPRLVSQDLYAVDIRDYRWDRKTVDKLADVDPYYHAIVEVEKEVEFDDVEEYGYWTDSTGKRLPIGEGNTRNKQGDKTITWTTTRTEKVKKTKKVRMKQASATSPFLPTKEMSGLIELTQCKAPILRGDWFFSQTVINANRVAGYYTFLGLKSRADFEKLTGFDEKKARERYRATLAIIRKNDSGVAQQNRLILGAGAIGNGYWKTLDVFDSSTKRKNAIAALDDEFEHDAEEHYGFLPNYLFAFYLSDVRGVQQDSAPDKIGSDTTSTNNDGRIHVCLSCIRCHKEGLRPIRDFARKLFAPPGALEEKDYDRFERLRSLYLNEFQPQLDADRLAYEGALWKITLHFTLFGYRGWAPGKLSSVIRDAWRDYADTDLNADRMAFEVGVDTRVFVGRVRSYVSRKRPSDNVLKQFLHEPPYAMDRDSFEERYAILATIARGLDP